MTKGEKVAIFMLGIIAFVLAIYFAITVIVSIPIFNSVDSEPQSKMQAEQKISEVMKENGYEPYRTIDGETIWKKDWR